MADEAKGKGIAPKRASNPADPGQSSRPLLPIRTLLEDKKDGEDYSEVIEVLKQHIKSYKRVIASQSSDIKILLLSLNTLKASVEDNVSAIKNISSTLASLTNSSNAAAATTGKTSYSPRFDPFSGTIDLDSPLRPPRKEPYLGPAVNSATSNLDPSIDIGSKEGFKETITSSIVKELSKKAYTILDDSKLSREKSRNLAIEAYRAAYVANSSNSTPNSNSNPSKKDHISNSKERFTTFTPNIGQLRPINTGNGPVSPASIGSIILEVLYRKAPPTYTKLVLDNVLYLPNIDINIRNKIVVEIPFNSIRKKDYRPIIEDAIVSEAIEPNKRYKLRNSPAKGTTLEGAPYQSPYKIREPEPLTSTRDLPYVLRELVIEGNKVEKAISSPTLKEPNIGQRDYYNLLNLAKLWHVRLGHIGLRLLKKTSSITKGLSHFDQIKEADFHCSSYDRGKAVRRVSKALIPDLPRVLDSIVGDTVKIRPRPYNRNPIVLLLVDRKKRYRAIGARGEAIIPLEKQSKSLKFTSRTEECKLLAVLGSKTYLVYILSRRVVLKTSTIKFIEDNIVLSQPTDNIALEGELVDLGLDLEGAVSPDPFNLNTEKPISIEIGPSKLEPYESSSDSKLDKPLPDKPINPVKVGSTRPTISIRKPELPEAFP
ncbi:hypothetical protein P8C59_009559 [Phyllachora maydis]|uniref:GAG-pre-integrase domain-containing protein n=1 Tax=Phyllachora maydis TaxID=1825666 RepID=A0AAD9IE79_9PEZI|nr:hypothetical protein P8C59_009559 [Phyllachora maydis]